MKHFVKTSIATAVMGAALIAAGGATAGTIANTKHNLGSTGTGPNSTTGTGEICVFCHTPHGGDIGAPVPLWNKTLSDPGNFTTYDQLGTSTLDAAVGDVGSVSLACLTCHDGTQAIDNIINAPGSGGYDSTGGGAGGLDWAWTSTDGSLNTTTGTFQNGVDPAIGGNNIFQIGTDLRNDHPVSMQYGGGGVSASAPAADTTDTDFAPAVQIGSSNRWYVDNATMDASPDSSLGVFDKWDFKLYTRNTNGLTPRNSGYTFAGEPEPFVECGSCHDPHLETTTFLRIDPNFNPAGDQSNSGSRICLSCHTK